MRHQVSNRFMSNGHISYFSPKLLLLALAIVAGYHNVLI
jgi:hypothetical protein